jgi:putative aldouronate transport system permease protein
MILPGMLWYFIFRYIPMYGVVMAFKDYKIRLGILGSEWVGFKYFIKFFEHPYFFRLMKNTFLLSILSMVAGLIPPLILALALNELRHQAYKRVVQTVSYLPHFISTVAIVGMATMFLSPVSGFINTFLVNVFNMEPIYFLMKAEWVRPIYIGTSIWQDTGWGAIIYLAVLSSLDMSMYEAATIDGATRIQKIRYISLPCLKATVIILLLLNIGKLLNVGFEKVFLLQNPVTYTTSDVISTYIYRRGLQKAEFSYGAAVGLFNSCINLLLLITANFLSKKFAKESLF